MVTMGQVHTCEVTDRTGEKRQITCFCEIGHDHTEEEFNER